MQRGMAQWQADDLAVLQVEQRFRRRIHQADVATAVGGDDGVPG